MHFDKSTKEGSRFNRFLALVFGRPVHIAVELVIFNKVRSFSDGVDIFNINLQVDYYKGDHNPKIEFIITIFNVNIIEFNIYNTYHYSDEDDN